MSALSTIQRRIDPPSHDAVAAAIIEDVNAVIREFHRPGDGLMPNPRFYRRRLLLLALEAQFDGDERDMLRALRAVIEAEDWAVWGSPGWADAMMDAAAEMESFALDAARGMKDLAMQYGAEE